MTDLFWPGDERAGSLMSESAFLASMVAVEQAWLDALVASGIAPPSAKADLVGLVGVADVAELAGAAESSGSPVIPMVSLLRLRVQTVGMDEPNDAAAWLHRGLTSQDVVDTALVLCCRDVLGRLADELDLQVTALVNLADQHRATLMVGRTLTQHAVPITFGLKASGWLTGVLDAADAVARVRSSLGVQLGGAAGTMAAAVEMARLTGSSWPADVALGLVDTVAASLGLTPRMPWHTSRAAVTNVGDAMVACADAWGRIASDVLVGARPEIAELAEPTGTEGPDGAGGRARGGSSTMPQKRNPVLSVLVRRAAVAAPALGATLHTASSLAVDERPDGAWHVEWAMLRDLGRRAVVAGSQTREILGGLQVDVGRMRANLQAAGDGVLAEQRAMAGRLGAAEAAEAAAPVDYLGANDQIIDAALARAAHTAEVP